MPPTWNPQNLILHHQKRITKDAGCFEDLLAANTSRWSQAAAAAPQGPASAGVVAAAVEGSTCLRGRAWAMTSRSSCGIWPSISCWNGTTGTCSKSVFLAISASRRSSFPRAGSDWMALCAVLANQLLRQNELDQLVSHSWLANGTMGNMQQGAQPSVCDVYQLVVQNYRRWSLLRDAVAGRLEPIADPGKESKPAGEVWAKCRQLVVELNEKTVASCQPLMDLIGRDLRFHLRHYCHANLLVSWLMNGAGETDLIRAGRPGRWIWGRLWRWHWRRKGGWLGSRLGRWYRRWTWWRVGPSHSRPVCLVSLAFGANPDPAHGAVSQ